MTIPAAGRRSSSLILTLAVAGLCAPFGSALAQQAEAVATQGVLQEIMVVGSRIRRVDEVSSSPVQTLGEADLRLNGSLTLGETLQSLSTVGPSLNSNGTAGTSHGTASMNLRNLGENRSLVLVNGHRWVNGTGTRGFRDFVDLNTIPQAMIERIEVLQDGATAIYGADAIAGVVNMHTYKRFDGIRAKTYYGITSKDDREALGADVLLGTTWGNSSWILALGYVDKKPIFTQDRALTAVPLNDLDLASPEGWVRENNLAAVLGYAVPANGVTRDPGADGSVIGNWRPVNLATDLFNRWHNNYVVGPSEIASIYLQNTTSIGDRAEFRFEALHNVRKSDQRFSGGTAVIRGSRNFTIPNDPSVNPFGVVFSGSDFRIENFFEDNGQRTNEQEVKTTRVGAGLNGSFANGWGWDTFLSWAENKGEFISRNQVHLDRLALGMRACSTAGITVDVSDLVSGCVPVNLFNPMTPAMVGYINFTGHDFNTAKQTDFTFNVTGDVFELPAGALAFAAGVEYREEKGLDTPDSVINSTPRINNYRTTSSAPRDGTDGKYDLKEVYVEFEVPLLNDQPGAQSLSMQLATRYSDYSTFGDTTNSKVGLAWRPVDSLLFRGTWTEGFRAPSILELFEGLRQTGLPVVDPCSGGGAGLPGCAGVPPGYIQPSSNVTGLVGGNPNLDPETSENFSAGFVLTPAALPNASLTLDWYRVEIDNVITTFGAQNLLNLCATTGLRCNFIQRESSGEIALLADGPVNLNSLETEGIDVVARYLANTGVGTFNFTLAASRLLDLTQRSTLPNGSVQVEDKVGTAASREAYPKWRAMFTTRWDNGPWAVNYKARYIGDTEEMVGSTPRHIGSVFYHDLAGSYDFQDGLSLKVGIDNVFGKQPPASLTNLNINFDINTYDAVGRFMYAQLSWNFGL